MIICEAIPTMFFELETSLFDDNGFAGPAFAEAVIHSIKRKPETKNTQKFINVLQQLHVSHISHNG